MATIRTKLTVAYTGALLGSLAVYSISLYAARRDATRRDQKEALAIQADQALRVLRFAATAKEPVTEIRDPLVGAQITARIGSILEGLPGYVIMFDKDGWRLYMSPSVRALGPDGRDIALMQTNDTARTGSPGAQALLRKAEYERLIGEAKALQPGNSVYPITVRGNDIMLVSLPETDPTTVVARVVVGRPVDVTTGWLREFVMTLLVVAPIVIAVSVGAAYMIAGRAVEPVGRMINEVEAITDGRSLHRRLPVETTGDELARLSATLNAMIARLETSFSALRRFTADASHELKTPLAVLRADVERAMHWSSASNEQLVALEEALQETTRMADLVDSLLTLARADEGRFDLHREPFALEPLVHEVFETAVILGEDAGLEVSLPVVEDATILGDRLRLRQLFLNLITNAIKYTSRGGSVEVTLKRKEGEVQFAVKDTGIGIAAADLPYIFERFWRADRARSRLSERGGFGLGLAISQWIAQAHGGTLSVQSRLHRGSTFTVSVPIAAVALRAPVAETAASAVEASLPADSTASTQVVGD